MKTGLIASKLGIVAYIVPFMFVYSPELLLMGDNVLQLLWSAMTALTGTFMLAASVQGWLLQRLPIPVRIIMGIGALAMIDPGFATDIIGIIILAVVFAWQKTMQPKPLAEA